MMLHEFWPNAYCNEDAPKNKGDKPILLYVVSMLFGIKIQLVIYNMSQIIVKIII